jgi:PAS domain S-box-containing protein
MASGDPPVIEASGTPSSHELEASDDEAFDSLLHDVLDAAIEITGADMGNIQLLAAGALRIVAQYGFDAPFLTFFDGATGDVGACGAALRSGQRVTVVDVANSPMFSGKPEREVLLAAGVRGVQSTPFSDHSGVLLGVFSTHFRQPHSPDQRELRLLDLLARQTAAFVERSRFRSALRQSERQIAEILTNIGDGFVTLDDNWRFTFINRNASRLMGLSPTELAGQVAWEVFPEVLGSPMYQALQRAAAQRVSVEFEDFYSPLERWFAGKAYPSPDGGMAVYFHDVTSSKKSVLALAERENRLQHVTDTAAVMVAQCSRDLRYVFVNRSCAEFLGRPIEEIIGRPIVDVIGNAGVEVIRPYVDRVLRGERVEYEAEIPYPEAGPRHVRVAYVPDVDAEGVVCGWIATIIDVTERKQLEAERDELLASERAARGALERSARLKDEFLATLSHELRSPLSAILGWSTLLRQSSRDPATLAKGLEAIERNVRLQARLIDDLLDMSRILSGKLRMDIQLVSLPAIVEAAIDAADPAARAKGVQLLRAIEPMDLPVRGDSHRLHQVVWNVVSNAIKFTAEGGRVEIGLRRVDSGAEIQVSDTGIGIAAEFLPHVFERFRQVDSSTTREHSGLGLGLAIAKHLIQLHGGSVQATSEGVGRGATFTILLPLVTPHTAEQGALTGVLPIAAPSSATALSSPSLNGRKILVVDDDPDAREILHRLLQDSGASIHLATSADEAAEIARTAAIDLLVCDIGLPRKDGYQLIAELRRSGFASPAIAVTAFARSEDRARSLVAGYQMHLAKPVEPIELLAAVAALCK